MAQISVRQLCKHYQVHHKEPGLAGSLKSFVRRRYETVKAVDGVSFEIEEGEMVGFLGPNGAGKTTTLKVLSGLLYPTSGQATVLGFKPQERRKDFLKQFTLVMGQKNQLLWDLPAIESFLVNQAIYEIEESQFKATMGELTELLDLSPLLTKQVRKLSLGERMKCELAAALLHRPRVLFLDEPTIGLDVTMQVKIRQFVATYNQRYRATVILTSHYMGDVTALTRRIVLINKGQTYFDGDLRALVEQVAPYKLLHVIFRQPVAREQLAGFGEVETIEEVEATLRVPRGRTSEYAGRLLAAFQVDDVTIEEPPVEDIISQVFQEQAALSSAAQAV